MLCDYNGVVEVHVPNGQVNISEFAHALIARAIEQRIVGAPGSPRPQ
ncbi:MAG TPA: hypothetical protein VMN03_01900 [Burkholderiales bacterium]|nr:hypothetical protein [Burkholderiales bacterium]